MDKETKFDYTNWYSLWMEQSKEFFSSAEKNLQGLFSKPSFANPEDHMEQIQNWMSMLKHQWEFPHLTEAQKAYEAYWKMMAKMCNEASDMLLQQWIKRFHQDNPVKNIQELYELWLSCCHEVYQRSMHSKSFQDAYGEFMNAALKFWKSAIPK
jgi:hypothetical protein